jgi:flagellar basal body-associated protein FliL
MATKDTVIIEDSDPYVDMDPAFEDTGMEVVEQVPDNPKSQVSMKKIFFLLFLLLILVLGGLSGLYFLFYGNPQEHIADNWNPPVPITPEKTAPQLPPETTEPTDLTMATLSKSLTEIGTTHQSITDIGSDMLTFGLTNVQSEGLTFSKLASAENLTLQTSKEVTRTFAFNDLEPITPGLRSEPVLYRFKIMSDLKAITPTDDDIVSEDDTDETDTVEESEDVSETKELTSATASAPSLTETKEDKSKDLAAIPEPLGKRKKPIVFRATIPLILMYPELTLKFNSFLLLLPDVPSNTYVNIGVALKTSNEAVFKEIQDRKTFVRGAIFGILKRLFESAPVKDISGETIKKRIIKDINYVLIHGTVDDVYITNYLAI